MKRQLVEKFMFGTKQQLFNHCHHGSDSLLLLFRNNNIREQHLESGNVVHYSMVKNQEMREVINKRTALSEIDSLLGKKKPPAFEYIYVTPSLLSARIFSSDSSVNPYGHSAVRYTNPENGKSIVMNIVGKPGHRMVNFIPSDDYLFGHPSNCTIDDGNEQGGIYSRTMISFRFEEWPEEYIKQMHEYFVETQKLGDSKMAKYSMINGPVYNLLKGYSWFSGIAERGNCAYWATNGLKEAHILNSSTMWPKYTSIKLYTKVVMNKLELWEKWSELKKKSTNVINQKVGREIITPQDSIEHNDGILSRINEKFFDSNEEDVKLAPYWKRSNFNIVTYRCHDERMNSSQLKGWVKPFRYLEHLIFDEMDEMSNVIVEVKEKDNELVAVPSLKEPKHRPLWNL